MNWKTPYNDLDHGKYYTKCVTPSQTRPDQTMSIRTIMERYARGLPIGGGHESIFNGDDEDAEEFINYEKLDAIEKIEFQRNHQEKLKKLNEQYEEEEKQKRKKHFEKIVNEEVEKKTISLKTPPEGKQKE